MSGFDGWARTVAMIICGLAGTFAIGVRFSYQLSGKGTKWSRWGLPIVTLLSLWRVIEIQDHRGSPITWYSYASMATWLAFGILMIAMWRDANKRGT